MKWGELGPEHHGMKVRVSDENEDPYVGVVHFPKADSIPTLHENPKLVRLPKSDWDVAFSAEKMWRFNGLNHIFTYHKVTGKLTCSCNKLSTRVPEADAMAVSERHLLNHERFVRDINIEWLVR